MRYKVKRTEKGVTVEFTGEVVSNDDAMWLSWMGYDFISPRDIQEAIDLAEGKPITIRMDSIGGDLFAGVQIYSRLMDYPGQVLVDILSVSASASSVVAMVSAKEGNRCRISPLGAMVIHNVQTTAEGDYREMEATAETLRKTNGQIIAAYKKKTGIEEAQLREMLDKETWLTAEEAVEMGFADEVMFQDGEPPADAGTVRAVMARTRQMVNAIAPLSAAAIRKVMEDRQRKEEPKEDEDEKLQMATRLLELEENRF